MSIPTQPVVQDIPLGEIHPSQFSLRPMDETTVAQIAASMQQQGQLSHILVRRVGDGYELVYGNHRLAAARQLNWATIRCEVRSLTDDHAFLAAWSENTARNEFVDPIAEGRGFDTLTKQGYTQTAVAREIGRPQQYVSGRVSLLRLEPELQTLITSQLVPAEHGIELSRLDDTRTRRILAELSRRDRQNPLRLEELRTLSRLPWEQFVNDLRVAPLLANDPIEQNRLLRARIECLETTIKEQATTIHDIETENMMNRLYIESLRYDMRQLTLEVTQTSQFLESQFRRR